jgi:hypothetical protein
VILVHGTYQAYCCWRKTRPVQGVLSHFVSRPSDLCGRPPGTEIVCLPIYDPVFVQEAILRGFQIVWQHLLRA